MTTHTATIVVGGGQAGLATAQQLGQRGIAATVLDASSAVGDAWRQRWDSLRLFTPACCSSLPGMPFPAPADHHPTKDEVADYLAAYVAAFDLDVRTGARVSAVERADEGFVVTTSAGVWRSDAVVVATGPFQTPYMPAVAGGLASDVVQLHSAGYRNPQQLPDGSVLVVGGGNSGCQIAEELAGAGRDVHLAVRTRMPVLPQRVLGQDLFRWLDRLGYLRVPATSRLGRRLQQRDTLIGHGPGHIARRGVTLHGRLEALDGSEAMLADRPVRVDAVVWATGFHRDHGIVRIPGALDASGVLAHAHGVTAVPGLFTIGQPWQHTRGSALLGFVGADATMIADRVVAHVWRNGPRVRVTMKRS